MKIETTPRDDHQLKLVVEVENEQVERKMHKAARHISEHAKIPGFRPGKAPYDKVVRFVGEERVREEAIEMLVDELYPQILKEQNIEPGATGALEDIVSMDPLTLSFIVPLAPKVDLKGYKDIRVAYEPKPLDDSEVEKTVEQYRSYYGTLEPLETPAEDGNMVYLTFSGKSGDNVVVEERPLQVKVAGKKDKNENEYPFTGFSRELVGMKTDDEKTVSHKYAADFIDDKFKGLKVEFSFKVQSVKKMVLPELDENFIHNFGDFATVEDFKNTIRQQLESNNQAEYDAGFYKNVIGQIKAQAEIKYPPQLVEEEKKELLKNFEHELSHQKMDLDTYLKLRKQTVEEFTEQELVPNAKEKLERNLILEELARTEKIQLTEGEMEASYSETLQDLSARQDFDQMVKKTPKKQLIDAIAMEAAARVMNRRVYETLKLIAIGEADKLPASEAIVDGVEATEKPVKPKTKKAKKVATEEVEKPEGE